MCAHVSFSYSRDQGDSFGRAQPYDALRAHDVVLARWLVNLSGIARSRADSTGARPAGEVVATQFSTLFRNIAGESEMQLGGYFPVDLRKITI
jgi:hypothetical protein